jgi:glycosyltransferase involved in cell wall biosynthesis
MPERDVAVCVCTYRRPSELARLITAVERLEFTSVDVPKLAIVIVDNDPDGSAWPVVERVVPADAALEYVPLGRGNIAAARNAAVAAGGRHAPLLALIDDDEVPEPQWLDALLTVRAATGSPIVIGPVLPRFPAGAPDWITEGGFFDLFALPDGARMTEGITGNALLDAAAIGAASLSFDEALGGAGGEDQLFFRTACARGLEIRYAAKATVFEHVPAERLTLRYLVRREFRRGNTLGLLSRRYPEAGEKAVQRLLKGAAWTAVGAGELLASPVRPAGGRAKVGAATGLLHIGRGLGMVVGVGGRVYEPYARARPRAGP